MLRVQFARTRTLNLTTANQQEPTEARQRMDANVRSLRNEELPLMATAQLGGVVDYGTWFVATGSDQ